MLATYFPIFTLTLLGDASVASALPSGAPFDLSAMPLWVQMLLPALGLWLFSTVVAAVNEVVRKRDAEGVPVSPRLRFVLAVANTIAANHDKAAQQAGKAKEPQS